MSKDIEKAIKIEKEYQQARMLGEYPYHLVDKIRECGFETLDEYFSAKPGYYFGKCAFEVIETTPVRAITDVLDSIRNKKTAVLFADTVDTIVWNGDNSLYNSDYCVEKGIPVLPIKTAGGTIVSTHGDLNIGICVPKETGVDAKFILDGLASIFRKYTDKKVTVERNDILIDGYKVLGSSTYDAFGMFVLITPVSMTEKMNLISSICLKKSEKIPARIDFMDATTLRQEVSEWLSIQSI